MRPVCVTVDVEDFFLPRPPFDTVFARTSKGEFGIGRIMSALEAHGAPGTFYVDVLNRTTLTKELLSEACREIKRRGHELGLHTHPAFPGRSRGIGMQEVMFRLSPEAQESLIREASDLISQWTGEAPCSHRAGGYGANRATLEALGRCGFTSDSSHYHGYAGCPLATEFPSPNTCFDWAGVREIPVSITRNRFGLPLPGGGWLGPILPMKIDLNWLDAPGLITQINACLAKSHAPVILFLHSYSLLDLNKRLLPSPELLDRFNTVLGHVASLPGARFSTVSAAAAMSPPVGMPNISHLPPCDFPVLTNPLRWARFARAEFSWERIRKLTLIQRSSP